MYTPKHRIAAVIIAAAALTLAAGCSDSPASPAAITSGTLSPEQVAVAYQTTLLSGDGAAACAMEVRPIGDCKPSSPITPDEKPHAVSAFTHGSITGVYVKYSINRTPRVKAIEIEGGSVSKAALISDSAPLTEITMREALQWGR